MKNNVVILLIFLILWIPSSAQIGPLTFEVPDENFEQALIDAGIDSGTPDGTVLLGATLEVTELQISSKGIKDLTGIEFFPSLTILDCSFNRELGELDISENPNLVTLWCGSTGLTTLNITKNTKLEFLSAPSNNINTIDVSKNKALGRLNLAVNQLTSLDLSQNTNLKELFIDENSLKSLNLSQNTLLETIITSFNELNSIDLSKNEVLKKVLINDNNLNVIDVTKNINIEVLHADRNKLTSLDVSKNKKLVELLCQNNKLSELNLKPDGNRTGSNIKKLVATNNPDLQCIKVGALIVDRIPEGWTKDETSFYDIDCRLTMVPDEVFEKKLIDLEIDTDKTINGRVLTRSIEFIKDLSMPSLAIRNLKGIEDFKALERLDIIGARLLKNVDLSNNLELKILGIGEIGLSELDISKNIKLERMYAGRNNLTSLDVSKNVALKRLRIDHNAIKSLDVSTNGVLEDLDCSSNKLTHLNLKDNTPLFNSLQLMKATENPDLVCIQIPMGLANAIPPNWRKDNTSTYSEDCTTLSVDDFLDDITFSIYPNPSVGIINISSNTTIKKVETFDMNGVLVKEFDFRNSGFESMDLSGVSKGIYLLRISSRKGIITKNILIN